MLKNNPIPDTQAAIPKTKERNFRIIFWQKFLTECSAYQSRLTYNLMYLIKCPLFAQVYSS